MAACDPVARCHRYNKLEPMEHVEYLCLPHGTAPIVGNSVDANNYNTTLSVLCAEPRVSLLLLRLQITSFRTKETTICFGMVSCSPCVHSITKTKQRIERKGSNTIDVEYSNACDVHGKPIDPRHPSNKIE
jgi:hypothetical protein